MMTKRHFEAIAQVMAENLAEAEQVEGEAIHRTRRIARDLGELFGEENPRFDLPRFLDACGVDRNE